MLLTFFNAKLRINKIYFKVETGIMEKMNLKGAGKGNAFIKEQNATYGSDKKLLLTVVLSMI